MPLDRRTVQSRPSPARWVCLSMRRACYASSFSLSRGSSSSRYFWLYSCRILSVFSCPFAVSLSVTVSFGDCKFAVEQAQDCPELFLRVHLRVDNCQLVLAGWTGVILTFAALTVSAAAIYAFLTKDPCRT